MMTLRPLLVAVLITLPAGGYSACPDEWVEYEGSCYYGSDSTTIDWEGAKQICRGMHSGADLTSISSAEENAFIDGRFGHLMPWIGLNDIEEEGFWRWANGENIAFTNWEAGQPDNTNCDCAYIWKSDRATWDDYYCEVAHHFVCEMPAV